MSADSPEEQVQWAQAEPPFETLDTLIGLARTQMLAQVIHSDNYDLRLVGLLGFNGALIVVDITLKKGLGKWWWAPLIGLALSSILCLWSRSHFKRSKRDPAAAQAGDVRGSLPLEDRRKESTTATTKNWFNDFGPNPKDVLEAYGLSSLPAFQEQLLVDLNQTLQNNNAEMLAKQKRLLLAVMVVLVTVLGAAAGAIGFGEIAGAVADAAQKAAEVAVDLSRGAAHQTALAWNWLKAGVVHLTRHARRLVEEMKSLDP